MRTTIAAAAFTFAFAVAGSAGAQSGADPRLDAAREMMRASGSVQMYASNFAAMVPAYSQSVNTAAIAAINQNPRLSAEGRKAALAKLAAMRPQTEAEIRKVLTDPGLVDIFIEAMASLQASHLTLDELRQVAAFYKTPAGRKSTALLPRMAELTEKTNNEVLVRRINAVLASAVAQADGTGPKGQSR